MNKTNSCQFVVGTHTIDFSKTFPIFDGKTIAKKDSMVRMFRYVLNEIGYSFEPFARPVPPMLLNWQIIDKTCLRRWIIKCLRQLSSIPTAIIRMSYLDIDGFCFYDKTSGKTHKLVHCIFIADGYRYETTTTINLVSGIVCRFMQSNFQNKQILIN